MRVGFVITLSDGWIGGANYFRSLLSALYESPERKIDAVVFTGFISSTNHLEDFPAENIVRSRLFDRGSLPWLIRKLWQRIFKRDLLLEKLLKKHGISVLSHSGWLGKGASIPAIGWIPDFQHVHLPELFDVKEIALRDRNFQELCRYCTKIIVSSFDAQSDLLRFQPECKSKTEVLQFAVSSNKVQTKLPSRDELETRYKFVGNYFLLPNQFWRHKNHRVVIEALGLLNTKGKKVLVLATGNTEDYRSPQFFALLMDRANELDVLDNFQPLGLVPAHDLAALMRYAAAIINPSYFEGWSTTVEEAKSLGKRIVVSDIAVHREQNPPQARFFPPDNPELLASILWDEWNKSLEDEAESIEYAHIATNKRRMEFAKRYQHIVLSVKKPLPNLVIVGAPKSGTTSLFHWLSAHPSVVTSVVKETYYLMDPGYPMYQESSSYLYGGLNGYANFFQPYTSGQLCIEATPDYMYQQTALKVLSELPTRPTIVFILRNPVDRVLSLYRFAQNNVGSLSHNILLSEFVRQAKSGLFTQDKILNNVLLHSEYHTWLEKWIQACGKERVVVLFFEDMVKDPFSLMTGLCTLTGIDVDFYNQFDFKPQNQSHYVRSFKFLHLMSTIKKKFRFVAKLNLVKKGYYWLNVTSKKTINLDEEDTVTSLYEYFAEPNRKLSMLLDKTLPEIWTLPPLKRNKSN